MSIPLDKLYHYIESIAQDIRGDNVLIYRFFPHGSKKLEDMSLLKLKSRLEVLLGLHIYCNDQEPLRYKYYQTLADSNLTEGKTLLKKYGMAGPARNFIRGFTIYDKCLLLHSEQRSENVKLYQDNRYIPVYYWSHAVIAQDWFRYACHEKLNKNIKKQFLIYNRAWSGTREYRLKFIDLLIKHNIVDQCLTSFNPVEPELDIHYTQHSHDPRWLPDHNLEYYIPKQSEADSNASADYNIDDYNATEFEVVLETLFDDERLHLTEKILRPIALGQPFLLAATHGSLEYLRSYGFRTFASVIDESYDSIEDPVQRLEAIVKSMKDITNWSNDERNEKEKLINQITEYNRRHFFSGKFNDQVIDELKQNLTTAIVEHTNTDRCERHLEYRKIIADIPEMAEYFFNFHGQKALDISIQQARSHNMRILPK